MLLTPFLSCTNLKLLVSVTQYCMAAGYVPLTEEEMQEEQQRRAAKRASGNGEITDSALPEGNELELLEAE